MALPNAMTYNRNIRDSADEISQGKPLNISDQIYINDPNENQFLGWVLRQGVKESTDRKVFGHIEDAPLPNWVTFVGTTETSQGTVDLGFKDASVTLPARIYQYARLYNPRNGEILHFPAAFDTSATDGYYLSSTVTRNYGAGNTSCFLNHGDKLLMLTPSFYEGFDMGEGQTNAKVYKSFYTGIVSYPVRLTNTEAAERSRGGDPFAYFLNKSWKQAKDQMEAELIFGAQNNDETGSTPLHVSEGLMNYVTTNVYAVDGYMSRLDFWSVLAEWGMYNKAGGSIICSTAFVSMVAEWAFGKVQYDQNTNTDGMTISYIMTPRGQRYDLVVCDLFDQDFYLAGTALLVPNGQIQYRPLVGNGMNLDIGYSPVNRDEKHAKEGEIYGEYGWEFFEEEKFGYITGLEF